MHPTLERIYNVTTCTTCGRRCGDRAPVTRVRAPHAPAFDGDYCRRCIGPVLVDLIGASFGADTPVALALPIDLRAD